MKNLIPYKVFESQESDSILDVKDILLELEDDGFIIESDKIFDKIVNPEDYPKGYRRVVTEFRISKEVAVRHKASSLIKWGEIKDTILRLTEYVEENEGVVRCFLDGTEYKGKIIEDDIAFWDLRLLVDIRS